MSRASRSRRSTDHVAPKPVGGDRRSRPIEAYADLFRPTCRARAQILLLALREALQEHGVAVGTSRRSRFLARYRITRKPEALDGGTARIEQTFGKLECLERIALVPRGAVRRLRRASGIFTLTVLVSAAPSRPRRLCPFLLHPE